MADANSTPYGVVYCIEHKLSGKKYVGQTVQTLKARWRSHIKDGCCEMLHRAISKHGVDAFSMFVLAEANSKDELDKFEDFYIKLFKTTDRNVGYNLREGGSFGKHSESSKRKMSEKVRFAYSNTDLIEKRRSQKTGQTLTEEQRLKLSRSNLGKKHKQETINKLSETRKRLWEDETARENMRLSSIEARKSDSYKATVSKNSIKQWADPDCRARLIASQRASFDDPVRKAARLAKSAATRAAKKQVHT